jgi:two-component system, sensor histidine kinase LadS
MKLSYSFIFILLFSIPCISQKSLLENSTYKINKEENSVKFSVKDTISFSESPEQILLPKYSTLRLKFKLQSNQDSTVFIYCNNQGYVKLFEINQNGTKLIGETGYTCPYHKRSIRNEISFIRLNLQKGISKTYLLEVKNHTIQHNNLILSLYDTAHFQEFQINQNNIFNNKYGQPIFLGVVALILLITIIQCILFREKIYFLYLLYIVLILLRVAMGISLLVVEDFFPVLNKFGFISRFSQTFSYLSIITYLLFVREFTHISRIAPLLNKIVITQIILTTAFLIFELFVVVEKYTVPKFITIFHGFELLEAIFVVILVIGLIRLYHRQNKYLIFGVAFLFLVSVVGQQLFLRLSSLSRLEQDHYLRTLWGIAYLGEMVFFTIGLFDRAVIMKKTIAIQSIENQKLMETINRNRENDSTAQPTTISIATNKGINIIQQDDICRVEASGAYTIFHVQSPKQIMASDTMAEFEDKLNTEKFVRVHKSHIVNLQFIAKYNKGDGGTVTLIDGSEIPVSRSRKEELLKKLFPVL